MRLAFTLCAIASALLITSCASHNVPERISLADRIAAEHRFSKLEISTNRFDLTAYLGPQRQTGTLHLYIEGDGFAWVTRRQPSRNPTPINPVALKLAVLDSADTAYLARPCQYVAVYKKECEERYWTFARFTPEVVDATNDAVTQLKQRTGAQKLVLIGYSGGGAIAALVAARRTDVVHLITVAGNLDHKAWTRLHGLPGLTGSLNPPDFAKQLANIRQTHFIGEADDVVPIDVYRSYRSVFTSAKIAERVVPQMDHACCWDTAWSSLLNEISS